MVNNFYTRSAAIYIAQKKAEEEAKKKKTYKCPYCGGKSFHNSYHIDFWIRSCNNQDCSFECTLSCHEGKKRGLRISG